MELLLVRIASLVAVAFIYMMFDVFNKRNVPAIFAYASVAYGFVLTLLYFDIHTIVISIALSLVVLGLGYVVYRIGEVGAGDILEFAALSLMLPLQPLPIFGSALAAAQVQLSMPFIISLFIASGVFALVAVPVYYIPRSRGLSRKYGARGLDRKDLLKAALVGVAWIAFAAFLAVVVGIRLPGLVLLAAIMLGSVAVIIYEKPITNSMVDVVGVDGFEEGDIIAFNLMTAKQIDAIKGRVKSFDRLVTSKTIKEMKSKRVKARVPVYKRAIPLAVPIFAGVVISILFGNVILFLLPP